jgi:hypothetical protein
MILITGSCITQFLPETKEASDYLVVDGLITDQNSTYTVSLSRSSPLNSKFKKRPVTGAIVSITDDLGKQIVLKDQYNGIYITGPPLFRGVVGRKYVLNIISGGYNYMSESMEMKAVPAIGSIEGEKITNPSYQLGGGTPGYQVFVSTYDSTGKTGYYRWEFIETWEFRLPFDHSSIINRTCWKTDYSRKVFITSTKSMSEDRVYRFPLNFITTETDRLTRKYSLLLKQYALTENEYLYWDKIQRIIQETGGLYDVVPISVKGNITCIDDPTIQVLGYFSVSAVSEKRLFIKPDIKGFPNWYKDCPNDTVYSQGINSRLFKSEFPIQDYWYPGQSSAYPYYVVTYNKSCWDCSLSGSTLKPYYWDNTGSNPIPKDDFDFKKF